MAGKSEYTGVHNRWKNNAVQFDHLYTGRACECKVPYFGKYLTTKLNQRIENALRFLEYVDAKKIIDLGCGTGTFAVKAALKGVEVYGYDISEEAIRIARAKAEELGVSDKCFFYVADILAVDFPAADVWFDLGCLQYLPDISIIIARLSKIEILFSCLPMKYHWLNFIRFIYRRIFKGNPYYTYTQRQIRYIFSQYKHLYITKDSLQYYISSISFFN